MQTDEPTDKRSDIATLIDAFRNSADAPKTASEFYCKFLRERVKRLALAANVSAGNTTLRRGRYVAREQRVERTCC